MTAPTTTPLLTDDDRVLLDCIRDGLQLKQTARQLDISHAAATMRILRLRQRFGCTTTAQLVAKLFDLGLLTPRPVTA